jgi:NAD(P)H-flavin reductase
LYFVAGGIGLPPLRSVINHVLARRNEFGKIKIFYGARTPEQHCFQEELPEWRSGDDVDVRLIADEADDRWPGPVGVVTELWDEDGIAPGGVAFVCGPPVMMKFAVRKLVRSGFKADDIHLTLERHMKCGIGKCGHCNIGDKFVCTDGPVFTYAELKNSPAHEEAL